MTDRGAMLPYIKTHRSYSPTLYVADETPYSRAQRKKWEYWDNYYRLHPHHSYWYDYHNRRHDHPPPHHQHHHQLHHHPLHAHPKDYYTRVSLPDIRYPYAPEEYVDPRLEAHYRHHRDRDPYCAYCPPAPKKLVPSMQYDESPCPKCEHPIKERQQQVIAFPWTPQTHVPKDDGEDLRLPLPFEDEPPPPILPYAQSAPPLEDTKKGAKGQDPPYSAPPFRLLKPREGLLSVGERRKAAKTRPEYMSAVPEDPDIIQNHISPDDSISNVGLQPFRSLLFHPSRLKPAHSSFSERYFKDLSRRDADPTPPPIGYLPPRRRMQGQYVDIRNGRKYDYRVNYGKSGEVDGERRVVR